MDEFTNGFLVGQNDSNSNNGGFFNGDGIWAIILLALLFGWGGNGGIGGGGGGGGRCGYPCATQADVRDAVDQQTLISKLDQQTYGIADSTYALNNTISNGFHGVDRGLCDLSHQISDCCCTTQRSIDGVRFDISKGLCDLGNVINMQTRDIIDNQNANYRGIMDFMVQSKMDALRSENDNLRLRASQADQNAVIRAAIDASTAEIIRRTGNDCPVPSYLVQPPTAVNFPVNSCGTVQFGGYSGHSCGCGCGCNG